MYRTINEKYATIKAYDDANDALVTLENVPVSGTDKKPVYTLPDGMSVVKVLDTAEVSGKYAMSDTLFLELGEDRGQEGVAGPGYYGATLYVVPVRVWFIDKDAMTLKYEEGKIAGAALNPDGAGYSESTYKRALNQAVRELALLRCWYLNGKLVDVDVNHNRAVTTYVRMRRDAFLANADRVG